MAGGCGSGGWRWLAGVGWSVVCLGLGSWLGARLGLIPVAVAWRWALGLGLVCSGGLAHSLRLGLVLCGGWWLAVGLAPT